MSESGLLYSVELSGCYGPYVLFTISVTSDVMSKHTTSRVFPAWRTDKTLIKYVKYDGVRHHLNSIYVDRDFATRMLLYMSNVAASFEDKTLEYAISALRSHKTTMVVGSGDDSILFHHSPLDLDISNYELHFAFDVKLFRMTVPYFCSKFFVVGSSGLNFVPDPVKLFVSLGSEKNDEESVMRERFISFLDLTKAYEDLTVCDNMTTLVSVKWGYSDFLSCSLFAIHSLRANFGQFMRLWRLCQQNVVFEKFNKKRNKSGS
uniref:RdRp n=1 Tax=Plum bark necrosis stem pitting-associated virus TaxID=675077 RepID=A0A891XIQ6_9CLOS|nr:RdRp [Plum bark necrosis stem pitting-associated virus]